MGAWLEPALRFAHYALLLGLFGWTAFRLIGLRDLEWLSDECGSFALIVAAIAAPLVSIALIVVSIAAMMGLPVAALDRAMVEAMIFGTDVGRAFIVRIALLTAGLCALLIRQRTKAGLPLAAMLFASALLTLGWNGHAAATEGAIGLVHRLNNGVHLAAAGLWLGAIGWFLHLTGKAHRQPAQISAQALLATMHRFAPLGITLVAIVAATGLINSQLIFGLANSSTALTTDYGWLLAAKIVLVGAMLSFGAHNASIVRRTALAVGGEKIDTDVARTALRRSLAGELTLAVLVIGLVAALGMMTPVPM